jgi:hypothetical protein
VLELRELALRLGGRVLFAVQECPQPRNLALASAVLRFQYALKIFGAQMQLVGLGLALGEFPLLRNIPPLQFAELLAIFLLQRNTLPPHLS